MMANNNALGSNSPNALDDILNNLSKKEGKGSGGNGGGGGGSKNIKNLNTSDNKKTSSSTSSSSSPKISNTIGGGGASNQRSPLSGGEFLVFGDDPELNPLSKEQETIWEEKKFYSKLFSSFGRNDKKDATSSSTSSPSTSSMWAPAPSPRDILSLYEARDAEEAASEERAGGGRDGPRGLLALRSTKDRKRRQPKSNNTDDDDDDDSSSSSSSSSESESDDEEEEEEEEDDDTEEEKVEDLIDSVCVVNDDDDDEDVAIVLDDGDSLDQGLGLMAPPSKLTTASTTGISMPAVATNNTSNIKKTKTTMKKKKKTTTKKKKKRITTSNAFKKSKYSSVPEEDPVIAPPDGWDALILGDRFVSCPYGKSDALGLVFGSAEARGKRATMEDRAVCIPSLNNTIRTAAPLMGAVTPSIVAEKATPEYAFFAVYDGHSGSSTSETLSQAFHFRLAAGLGLVKATSNDPDPTLHLPGGAASRPLTSAAASAAASSVSDGGATLVDRLALIEKDVLINAALDLDLELQEDLKPGDPISGSTAIMALIRRSSSNDGSSSSSSSSSFSPVVVTIGNVGDSRAVLSSSGRAIDLSSDHKCSRIDEKKRIEAAGGQVIRDRLHGVLAVSRAFGDAEHKMLQGQKMWGRTFKANPLSAEPEIITRRVIRNIVTNTANNNNGSSAAISVDEFIVLACDGVWDVMTSQQAINFVRRRLFIHRDVRRAASELVDKALRLSSIDNVSVVVIAFNLPLTASSNTASRSRPSSRK